MQWKAPSYLGLNPSAYEWAQLAAYVDGEGHIGLSPRHVDKSKSLTFCGKVVVTNTDIRLAEWCREHFGMKFSIKPVYTGKRAGREGNWKPCYYAQASGFRAAWILFNCRQWFVLKGEQAEVVLKHQETTSVSYWDRSNKSALNTPTDILEYRLSLKRKLTELNKRGPKEEHIPMSKEA